MCSSTVMKTFVFCIFLYTVYAGENDIDDGSTELKMQGNRTNTNGKFSAAIACGCSLVVSPVCASNGATFKNKCTLDCENQRRRETKEDQLYVKCHYDCIVCVLIEWYKRAS
ncbi:uncharacterized protein LOC142987821 [Anticarsia gemmatalis]|uniref:uncharacterized protein LOC142987821 n=1 Tax=Anticarsia gemmatalis TaxID=129554 RepID=UPI003F76D2C4